MLQPLLTQSQIALAKQMRSNDASWREIGRALNVNHETARMYLDEEYREQRTTRIVLARKLRRKAHQQALLNGVSQIAVVRGMANVRG